jgi:acetyl-CoA C-acetyltransferase
MLGLDEGDPRGLTVTGGLPYAGGPGNNYCLHAVAAMLERLRARPGAKALVTGNGWYLTKHSASVLASASSEGFSAESLEAVSAPSSEGEDAKPVPVLARAGGAARIVTYTVVFDREGAPARGVVLGALEGEPGRFVAETPADRSLLEGLVSREAVGLRGRVSQHDGKNVFSPE